MYIPVHEDCIGNSKVCIHVSKECISNRKESDQCKLKKKLKKVMKLKQEEFEQGRVLEYGKDAQTPLADVHDAHNSVSPGGNWMSLGSNENSDAQRDENSVSTDNKFSEVFGFIFRSWYGGETEQLEL